MFFQRSCVHTFTLKWDVPKGIITWSSRELFRTAEGVFENVYYLAPSLLPTVEKLVTHFPNFTTCWRTIWLTYDRAIRRNSNPYCRFSLSHNHRNHSTSKVKNQRGKYEYSNSVRKIQVCAMFRAGDIRRNVLLKFTRLRMETPWFWLHYHETFNVK